MELSEIAERILDSARDGAIISVDGGVNLSTVQDVATAGADLAVTGSAFFLSEDKAEFVNKMNDLIRKCQ